MMSSIYCQLVKYICLFYLSHLHALNTLIDKLTNQYCRKAPTVAVPVTPTCNSRGPVRSQAVASSSQNQLPQIYYYCNNAILPSDPSFRAITQ
jgi:hypothetical protein